MNRFARLLTDNGVELRRDMPRTLQLNLTAKCNQTCVHCHVNAGPARREEMSRETLERILDWLDSSPLPLETADLTGGAPELHPHFRWLVEQLRSRGLHVMDRCNLSILFQPGQEGLGEFLAAHGVEIVASLPCYGPENVNAQRGDGVFDLSIRALRHLNALGYGCTPNLPLNLVYNPLGASLPPAQQALEADYKERLHEDFGVQFNNLYCLANLPIARFGAQLRRDGEHDSYIDLLEHSFNHATIGGLMCRTTLNVGWNGELYDCDFNAMLHLQRADAPHIWDVRADGLAGQPILVGTHCLGCTAGAGSSCGGALS
ncbi:radical SAM/Cys-rich domain protein [bacterium]|nr:MAG: radical SAM/Cys-rich domain protein [bacterium]